MVRNILFVAFLYILAGCTPNHNKIPKRANNFLYILSNDIVERELRNYNDSISNGKKLLHISIKSLNDTTYYEIREVISAGYLIENPSTFFVNTKIGIVPVSYINATVMFRSIEGVTISRKEAWEFLKEYFPKEYELYLKEEKRSYITNDGDIYIEEQIPITGGCIVWSLKFINEKYIGKKVFTER
ncbi:MAG: hypothetical protein ACOYEA_02840 [Fermentimonas sp.]|jgi:hypothetical protein